MDNMLSNSLVINEKLLKKGFKHVYNKTKVLVTGHTGFKGTWLTIWLKQLGAEVTGFALSPSTEPSIFNETKLESKVNHIIGDIRDSTHIKEVIQEVEPEFIFHLAAQPIVRLSYELPSLTYETNIMGVVNLLEAVRNTQSVKVVLNITTDKCYDDKNWVWGYRENDSLGGYDPYSSSKACSELITAAYRNSFFNPEIYKEHGVAIASARAGNVIGGGDWAPDRIVPDCIRALVERRVINIRNLVATRPWQHVLEPLSGYLWLGAVLWNYGESFASAWNFGPNDPIQVTVQQLAEQLIHKWGEGSWKSHNKAHLQPHESKYLKLDCSRSNHLLKWFSLYTAQEAIKKTVEWYKAYYIDKVDAYNYCNTQIREYTKLALANNIIWSSFLAFP